MSFTSSISYTWMDRLFVSHRADTQDNHSCSYSHVRQFIVTKPPTVFELWEETEALGSFYSDSSKWSIFCSSSFSLSPICRLGAGGWSPLDTDRYQWLQVDLGSRKQVVAIATQGRYSSSDWTSKYRLLYSDTQKNWRPYLQDGNIWVRKNVMIINKFEIHILIQIQMYFVSAVMSVVSAILVIGITQSIAYSFPLTWDIIYYFS